MWGLNKVLERLGIIIKPFIVCRCSSALWELNFNNFAIGKGLYCITFAVFINYLEPSFLGTFPDCCKLFHCCLVPRR
jgi:hypothetical protein